LREVFFSIILPGIFEIWIDVCDDEL